MKEEYFCLRLTEEEHYFVESKLEDLCLKHKCELKYYRQLKACHIPQFREVKIVGEDVSIGYLFNDIKDTLDLKYLTYADTQKV